VAVAVTGVVSLLRRLLCFIRCICNYILRSADVYFWEQGGQEYARRAELRELARLEKAEKEEAVRSTSEKDKKE
jgi:hypothetical protein